MCIHWACPTGSGMQKCLQKQQGSKRGLKNQMPVWNGHLSVFLQHSPPLPVHWVTSTNTPLGLGILVPATHLHRFPAGKFPTLAADADKRHSQPEMGLIATERFFVASACTNTFLWLEISTKQLPWVCLSSSLFFTDKATDTSLVHNDTQNMFKHRIKNKNRDSLKTRHWLRQADALSDV